jgi:hypothetical protein
MSSVPLFAPDGSVRQVPAEQLTDALNAGGKRAVQMSDPNGVLRYVPEDHVNAAMESGGKVYQPPQSYGFGTPFENTLGREIKSVGANIAGIPGAVYHAFADPATEEEQSRSKGLETFPGALGVARLTAQPLANAIDYYRNYAKSSPDQRISQQSDMLNVAPEAVGAGAASVLAPKIAQSIPGLAVQGAPPVIRGLVKGTNAVLSKAPEYVAGGAGAAIGSAIGGGYGAGIGGTIGAIAGKTLPKFTIPGENFGLPKPVYPGAPFPESPGTFPGAPLPGTPPAELLQAGALSKLPEQSALSASQTGEALGQIPTQTQTAPQQATPPASVPSADLTPVQIGNLPAPKVGNPYSGPRTPAVMEPVASGQISKIGYHPESQTAVIQFSNGKVYQYSGVPPEMYNNLRNSESVGSFFAQNIKGRYSTAFRGTVPQLKGAKAAQALLNQSTSLAQRIPTTTAGSPPAENQ